GEARWSARGVLRGARRGRSRLGPQTARDGVTGSLIPKTIKVDRRTMRVPAVRAERPGRPPERRPPGRPPSPRPSPTRREERRLPTRPPPPPRRPPGPPRRG